MQIAFIVHEDGKYATQIGLRESSGNRWFILPGDYITATAVYHSLAQSARPGTHRAMAMILDACDASLNKVVVTDRDESGCFHTKVEVAIGNVVRTLDIRPSDALALAQSCGAPFYVNNALLRAAT